MKTDTVTDAQRIEHLVDLLYKALPYVEDALEDEAYKVESVARLLGRINEALDEQGVK